MLGIAWGMTTPTERRQTRDARLNELLDLRNTLVIDHVVVDVLAGKANAAKRRTLQGTMQGLELAIQHVDKALAALDQPVIG